MTKLRQPKWVVPLLIGFALPIILAGTYMVFVDHPTPQERVDAKKLGVDPGVLHHAFRLIEAGEAKHDLTDAEFRQAKDLLNNSNPVIASYGLSAMHFLKNSRHRDEAILAAHQQLESSSAKPLVRSIALITLYKLNAPDWRQQVGWAKSGSNDSLRQTAERIEAKIKSDTDGTPLIQK